MYEQNVLPPSHLISLLGAALVISVQYYRLDMNELCERDKCDKNETYGRQKIKQISGGSEFNIFDTPPLTQLRKD